MEIIPIKSKSCISHHYDSPEFIIFWIELEFVLMAMSILENSNSLKSESKPFCLGFLLLSNN